MQYKINTINVLYKGSYVSHNVRIAPNPSQWNDHSWQLTVHYELAFSIGIHRRRPSLMK